VAIKFTKDPDAVLDYQIDWAQWLTEGDVIVASTFTPEAGITVDSTAFLDTSTTVWMSGGTVGETYKVVNHITTDGGRQDDRTITFTIKEL
jgi:hypothetical protein